MEDGLYIPLTKIMSFFKNKFDIFKNKLLYKEPYNNITSTQKPNNYSIYMSSVHNNDNNKDNEAIESKILQDTIIITTTTTIVTTIHSSYVPPPPPPPPPPPSHDPVIPIPCNVESSEVKDLKDGKYFYTFFPNYSKYNSNIISSLVDNIIDTIVLNDYIENKQKNQTYLTLCSDYYNSQLEYNTLSDNNTLNPCVFNEFEEIITNILTPNPNYLYKLFQIKVYSDDLINMYTRYGVFETNNFIIKIDNQSEIFSSELEFMSRIGKGIISPHNIVLPYYVHIVIKNKNRKNYHKMHFSIQPRVKNTIALHKWLQMSSNKFYHINYYIRMCINISKSILFIHSHELVHGDIKPDNILIEKYTNIPYIIDFGLSGINQLSPGTGGTRPFCCPETNNISDTKDDEYLWTKNNKRYDLWSIAFIFSTIIIFKDSYNYYSNYPHGYFTKDKYVNSYYLQRIPLAFREPFMLVLCGKSDINLSNFIRLLEDALALSTAS
jgi:hypothetical protein